MLLPAVVWSALRSNNISEVSRSIIQTWSDLITLRVWTFSFIHNTTQPCRVCKQSVFRFIQFRAESAGAKSGNTVTVTPELCSGQKWHFSSLSSVWGPEWGTRDTWRWSRTRAKSCNCAESWPWAGGWWHLNNEKWEQAPCQQQHQTWILTWNFTTVNTVSIFMFQFSYCYIDSSPKYLLKHFYCKLMLSA